MSAPSHTPDIFIIGGGPAGLAAAILARRKGFRVAVADHAQPPIDKACGEGLLPGTIKSLQALGVHLDPGDGIPFRGIRFQVGNNVFVQAKFLRGHGIGVRRTVLHAKLVQRAQDAGVALLWGAHVTPLGKGEFACDGRKIASRWIVGADGEHSQVRHWVTPDPPRHEQSRFGHRQHFQIEPWTDFVEVYWGKNCQIVVTPVNWNEVGVAVTSRNSRMKVANALLEVPELAQRLDAALASSRERGAPCALRRLRAVHTRRLALLGDASGSVDPLTGEGLGLSFRQAEVLTDAFGANNLDAYQSAHERIARVSAWMSRFMLWMDENARFRNRVLRTFSAEPSLFSRLLNTHVGALSPSAFGAGNALRLGWFLLSVSDAEM